jgi:transcriptional regulator GlxA family with amidase domain
MRNFRPVSTCSALRAKDYDFAEVLAKAGFGVAKLAHAHGLSVRQLERKLPEQFGAWPRDILQKIRMALAQERMHSDAPLKQIAVDLKYEGQTHLGLQTSL